MSRSGLIFLHRYFIPIGLAGLVLLAIPSAATTPDPWPYEALPESTACDLTLRLPTVPTRPALWFEADGLYPNCEALWWTLSDYVSPAELREAWRSETASRSRFLAALGSEASPKDQEAVDFFLSGTLTPELVPMWMAFALLADDLVADPASTLAGFEQRGLSATSRQRIGQLSLAARDLVEEAVPASAQDFQGLRQSSAEALKRMGAEPFRLAYEQGDVATLAAAAGTTEEDLLERLRSANRDIRLETAVAQLEELLRELDANEWSALRRYLLEHVAPRISFVQPSETADKSGGRFSAIPRKSCPWPNPIIPRPLIGYKFNSPIYNLTPSISDPRNQQNVRFKAKVVWAGPVSMLGCHDEMTVGCRLNYEHAGRPASAVMTHTNYPDFTDAEGFGSGFTKKITRLFEEAECIGISEDIPRCKDGSTTEGRRFHGWISWVVQNNFLFAYDGNSPPSLTSFRFTECLSGVEVSGPIRNLPAGEQVSVDLIVKEGVDEPFTVFDVFDGSTFEFNDVPIGSLVDLRVSRTSPGANCHFPNGIDIRVSRNGAIGIPLECCDAEQEDCSDPVLVGFSANGLENGQSVTLTVNVGGEVLSRQVTSNSDFLPLDGDARFAPGTEWRVTGIQPTGNTSCSANPLAGQVGEANFAGQAYRLTDVSCGCPSGADCEAGIRYIVFYDDHAGIGSPTVDLELQVEAGEGVSILDRATARPTPARPAEGTFPVTLAHGTSFFVAAMPQEPSGPFEEFVCYGDDGVVNGFERATIMCWSVPPNWCGIFPPACGIREQIHPPDGCGIMVFRSVDTILFECFSEACQGSGSVTYNEFQDGCFRLEDNPFPSLGGKSSSPDGPLTVFRMQPNMVVSGTGTVRGVARQDSVGVQSLEFFLDGSPIQLQNVQLGLSDPWTCSDIQRSNCRSSSGFQGLLDTTSISDGFHTLTVKANAAGGGRSTLADWRFEVRNNGGSGGGEWNAEVLSDDLPTALDCGEEIAAHVTMINTGSATWTKAANIRLGAVGDSDPFRNTLRIEIPDGVEVPHGGSHPFRFQLTAPAHEGTYITDWRMVRTGGPWFGETVSSTVEVTCPAVLVDDAVSDERDLPATMECGTSRTVTLAMRNSGTTTWSAAGAYRLGAVGGSDPFSATSRIHLPAGVEIGPTQMHPFQVELTAPQQAGVYRTDWQMVRDDTGQWFGEIVSGDIQVYCPPQIETLTLVPDADASVFQDNPTLTLPHDPTLYLRVDTFGAGRRTYMRFAVPPIAGTILSAKLRVRTRSPVPELAVYKVSNMTWSESTLNWTNQFDGGMTFDYLRSGLNLAAETYHEIDVDETVASGQLITIGMTSSYNEDQRLHGRTSPHQPQLVITYRPD